MPTADADPPPRRPRLLLAVATALATLPLLGTRDLWPSDEPRYAQVARGILRTGDWLVLHLNGERYTEKPPLFFWMAALLGRVFGDVNAWAARLPSALAGIACVVLVFEAGRRWLHQRVAFLGALLLVTTAQWWSVSQRAALDVLLAACVWAALACAEAAWSAAARGERQRARLAWLGFFAALGLGFLAKGPPALLFGALALVARAWAAEDWRSLRRVPWVSGLGVLALVIGLWAVPWAVRMGADEVVRILLKQTAGRMVGSAPHSEPPWYYLASLPKDALPWSACWVLFGVLAWRRRRGRVPTRTGWPEPGERVAFRFLGAWLLLVVGLFSCVTGKRSLYLVPILPACVLLTAAMANRAIDAGVLRRATRIVAALPFVACVGGLAVWPWLDGGVRLFGIDVPSPSHRALGELVRNEDAAGRRVILCGPSHADGILYYSGLDQIDVVEFRGDILALPADAHPRNRFRELLEAAGERASVVVDVASARAFIAVAIRPLHPVRRLAVDGREYELLHAGAP